MKKEKLLINTIIILMICIFIGIAVIIGLFIGRLINNNNNDNDSDSDTTISTREDDNIIQTSKYSYQYEADMELFKRYMYTTDPKYLVLVNAANSYGNTVPDDIVSTGDTDYYEFSEYNINNTALMALCAMCTEAKSQGINGIDITSAYRTFEKQTALFYGNCDKERQKNSSLTQAEAEKIVERYSCRPGLSEHQTGLAVDLCVRDDRNSLLNETFANTGAGRWLAENCYKFGFVLRFPSDKTNITNIDFEPWHFRFVGVNAASEMHEMNMCLEEYVEYIKNR